MLPLSTWKDLPESTQMRPESTGELDIQEINNLSLELFYQAMEYEQGFYKPFISSQNYPEVVERVNLLFKDANERTKRHLVMYILNLIASSNGK